MSNYIRSIKRKNSIIITRTDEHAYMRGICTLENGERFYFMREHKPELFRKKEREEMLRIKPFTVVAIVDHLTDFIAGKLLLIGRPVDVEGTHLADKVSKITDITFEDSKYPVKEELLRLFIGSAKIKEYLEESAAIVTESVEDLYLYKLNRRENA